MKQNKVLVIYGIIIFIILIAIIFILPDSFFLKPYKNVDLPSTTVEKKEFVDYEEQKENLLKNKYDYEYLLLDSMGSKTYTFDCSGTMNETIESGTCKSQEMFSYTESNKQEVFSKINLDYVTPSYIFNLIKDVEPKETKYSTLREYKYDVTIEDLQTDIIIYTNLNEISKIEISNAYMTYIIKYSNVLYWQSNILLLL